MDREQFLEQLAAPAGGKENIGLCDFRSGCLSVTVKDRSVIDLNAIRGLPGVADAELLRSRLRITLDPTIMEELQMKKSLTSKQQLDMLTAVQQIRELETAKREILHAIAEQQERIKTLMTDKQLEELELDEYVVRYVSVTSKRFNTSAFKKTHADLYEQYTETVSSKRFSIS